MFTINNCTLGTAKKAQWLKALVTLVEKLGSFPSTHIMVFNCP